MCLAGGLQKLASLLTTVSYSARWLPTNRSPHARLLVLCLLRRFKPQDCLCLFCRYCGNRCSDVPWFRVSLRTRYLVPHRFSSWVRPRSSRGLSHNQRWQIVVARLIISYPPFKASNPSVQVLSHTFNHHHSFTVGSDIKFNFLYRWQIHLWPVDTIWYRSTLSKC